MGGPITTAPDCPNPRVKSRDWLGLWVGEWYCIYLLGHLSFLFLSITRTSDRNELRKVFRNQGIGLSFLFLLLAE